jgi:hypothetical protein
LTRRFLSVLAPPVLRLQHRVHCGRFERTPKVARTVRGDCGRLGPLACRTATSIMFPLRGRLYGETTPSCLRAGRSSRCYAAPGAYVIPFFEVDQSVLLVPATHEAIARKNSIDRMNLDYACAAMLLRSIVVRVVYCFHALHFYYPLPQGQRVLVCALRAQPLAQV